MTRTIESHETALTLINQASFYADVKDLMQTLAARIVAGKFDAAKAVNGFTRLISQHVNGGAEWRKVYAPWKPTMADRKLAAAEMLEHYGEQLLEIADDMAGPLWVQVVIKDFGTDLNGNPTARHLVFSSTETGGMVKRLTGSWDPRRADIGYGDRLDSVPDAMRKAGLFPHNYQQVKLEGNRTNEIIVLFVRKPFNVVTCVTGV